MGPIVKGSRTRTKFTNVKVPMNAKSMQKPIAKVMRSGTLRRCRLQLENSIDLPREGGIIGAARFKVRYTRSAPVRLRPAKTKKLADRPKSFTTAAAMSRPNKLLATLPVIYAAEALTAS